MADDVRTLLLQIDATTQLLRSNLAAAESAVADFARDTGGKLDQVDSKFSGLGKGLDGLKAKLTSVKAVAGGLLAALGVGVGIGALVGVTKNALEYASGLGEIAQQLGVTTEQLQVYRYAASQVGVSQDEMDKGLSKLTKTLGEAQTGLDTAAKVFDVLGISLKNADGSARTAGDVLPLIADALAQIPDPAKRAAVEVELFGRAGQKLDTLLSGGSGAIDGLTKAAKELGLVIDAEYIQRADDAADKMSALKQVLEARIASTVAENADAILALANAIETVVVSAGRGIQWLTEFYNLQRANSGGAEALMRSSTGRAALLGDIDQKLQQNVADRASGRGDRREYLGGLVTVTDRADDASNARLDREFRALNRQRNAVIRYGQAAESSPAALGPGGRPHLSGLDTLNASAGGRGAGRKKEVDELQKQIDDLNKSAIAAINNLDRIEIGGEEKRIASNTKWFSTDDYDNIVKQIEARRDQEMNLFTMRKEEEAEIARIREGYIYDLSGLYEDLFRGGTSALWRDFKSMGIRAVAEVMARLAAGDSFKSAVGNVFSTSNHGAGGTLAGIASLFGGFFAGGGSPPMGKVSIVGERGPELFVPKVPGTIIPNGGFGGGGPVTVQIAVAANDYFDAKVVSISAPMAQQAMVGGAQLAQTQAIKKARRRL